MLGLLKSRATIWDSRHSDGGFTLLELLIVVAIVAVLAAVGIPMYSGFIADSKLTVAQNNLQSIYTAQQEYKSNNAAYYNSGIGSNRTQYLNTALFNGSQILDVQSDYYYYTVAKSATFTAYAYPRTAGLKRCTINHLKNLNCD